LFGRLAGEAAHVDDAVQPKIGEPAGESEFVVLDLPIRDDTLTRLDAGGRR
jgi:hypothetical protein